MKRTQKLTAIVLSCVMTFTSAVTSSRPVFADVAPAAGGKYISEVKIGYGEEAEDAAKALEGYTILKNDAGKYADLNEGASSKNFVMRKGTAVVYLGYKTTDDPSEAVTDLATMNMKGGYSFAQYKELMEELRDRQIRPFVDRFLAAIREYRENYNSDIEANQQKAVYVHDMLNLLTDLGENGEELPMGDRLLELTKDEGGDGADLTEILMKGSGAVVLLLEQLLVYAADTAENTWLDRFLAYGQDGLLNHYLDQDMEPSEARSAMAAEYEDTALLLAQKWNAFRGDLMEVRSSELGQELSEAESADAAGSTEDSAAESIEEGVEEGIEQGVPTDDDSMEASDDADFGEIIEAEIDEELEERINAIPDGMEAEDIIEREYLKGEINLELTEENTKNQLEMLYLFLYTTPYGDGTLLDFFLKPADEVSGDNIAALYPIAASLSNGQRAGVEFLSLEQLVQIGSTDNRAYEIASEQVSELLGEMPSISLYDGVNLELFGDGVALTSEALRKDPSLSDSVLNDGTLGVSTLTMVLGGVSVLSGTAFAFTLRNAVKNTTVTEIIHKKVYGTITQKTMDKCQLIAKDLTQLKKNCADQRLHVIKINITRTEHTTTLHIIEKNEWNDLAFYDKTFDVDAVITSDGKKVDEMINELNGIKSDITTKVEKIKKVNTPWGQYIAAGIFGLIMVGLSAYTIYRTYNEMYAYYHQEMTPIPKYMVDEKDIVTYGDDGTKTIRVNQKAYYKAADMAKIVEKNDENDPSRTVEAIEETTGDLNGDVAKQWLALYYLKNMNAPILADSLKVVTGTNVVPDGYESGIHMFGSVAAENLTNSHYTYNDGMNGIYVYYKVMDTSAAGSGSDMASAEGSAFANSRMLLAGSVGAVAGALLSGLVFTVRGKRKEQA